MQKETRIKKAYEIAREEYPVMVVDTDRDLTCLDSTAVSIHCWQTDDASGGENPGSFF